MSADLPALLREGIVAFAKSTEPGDTAALFLPGEVTGWLLVRTERGAEARPATDDELALALMPAGGTA